MLGFKRKQNNRVYGTKQLARINDKKYCTFVSLKQQFQRKKKLIFKMYEMMEKKTISFSCGKMKRKQHTLC